jgi:O-antigen ligase
MEQGHPLYPALPARQPLVMSMPLVFGASSLLAIAGVLVASNPFSSATLLFGGIVALALLLAILIYTTRHPAWVIVVILMAEMLSSNVFVPEGVNTALRYGVEVLFCAPLLPMIWRAGIASKGGFRLYLVYFAWCILTVSYSLSPVYSLGRGLSAMLLIGALSAIAVEVSEEADIKRLLRIYLVGCGILVFILVISAVVLPSGITFSSTELLDANGIPIPGSVDPTSNDIPRFVGIFTQPNEVGALVLVVVGVALVCWISASRRARLLLALLILAAVGLGIAADSRSSMGALGAGLLAYTLWRFRWRGVLVCTALALTVAVAFATSDIGSDYLARGDVSTLTGRTDVWAYSLKEIGESPFLGYGYEVEGAIYQLKHFPLWWGPWDEGPRSSLHNNYLSHLVGVGVPATLLWLFIVLRPWFSLFRQDKDPWGLKPIGLLVVLPLLVLNFTESGAGDCHYCTGVIFILCWAIAEHARLSRTETVRSESPVPTDSPLMRAIASAAH